MSDEQGTQSPDPQTDGTQSPPPAPDPTGQAPEPDTGTQSPPPATSDSTDWKAAAQKWEREAKARAKELSKVKAAVNGAEQTEATLAETKARAEAAEREATRLRVALAKGLPPDLATRLLGDDEDAMAEDADRLLALVGKPKPGSTDGGKGTGKPPQGEPAAPPSDAELLRSALGR